MASKATAKKQKPRRVFPKKYEDFCQYYHSGMSARSASKEAGLSANTGTSLLCRPDILARLKEIEKEYGAKRLERRVDHDVDMVEFIDLQVMHIAEKGERQSGRTRACALAYQRHRLIEPPGARIQATAQAGAQAVPQNATAFQVYEGKWMAARKAEWNKQLEQKHVSQLPAAPSSNT